MMILQAIETRYIGPTNHRDSRIIATTASGLKLTRSWKHELNIEANHYEAAKELCEKLEWGTIKAGGATKNGYAWVLSTLED